MIKEQGDPQQIYNRHRFRYCLLVIKTNNFQGVSVSNRDKLIVLSGAEMPLIKRLLTEELVESLVTQVNWVTLLQSYNQYLYALDNELTNNIDNLLIEIFKYVFKKGKWITPQLVHLANKIISVPREYQSKIVDTVGVIDMNDEFIEMFHNKTIRENVFDLTGVNSRKLEQLIISRMKISKDLSPFYVSVVLLNNKLNLNHIISNFDGLIDKLSKIIGFDHMCAKGTRLLELNIFRPIIELYNEKRLVKLLLDLKTDRIEGLYLFKDLCYIKEKLDRDYPLYVNELSKKPKSINSIHNELVNISQYLAQEDTLLNQTDILKFEVDLEDINISVPMSNFELIRLGSDLNNCVGCGSYLNKILKGEAYILRYMYFKEEYCIQLDRDLCIKQATGYANKKIDIDALLWLNDHLHK